MGFIANNWLLIILVVALAVVLVRWLLRRGAATTDNDTKSSSSAGKDRTSSMLDYYDILQVSPRAEQEVIEGAYKRLALKYHPDTSKSADAARRIKELNAAYEVLSNPTRRAEYDQVRSTYQT